ncbi:hypothetical protein [Gilliamella apicola]|uniref:hypothetical protein n=1 Tax=Gilliamella apicola TaxID=1196095 RepID=UPI00117B395D|nr:hypothetical protein [Gilliamella apicola]
MNEIPLAAVAPISRPHAWDIILPANYIDALSEINLLLTFITASTKLLLRPSTPTIESKIFLTKFLFLTSNCQHFVSPSYLPPICFASSIKFWLY